MRFEAATLRQAPPDNLTERAYAVMNAVTTAWQMKDWVYESLRQANRLAVLHQIAGRRNAGSRDLGCRDGLSTDGLAPY